MYSDKTMKSIIMITKTKLVPHANKLHKGKTIKSSIK